MATTTERLSASPDARRMLNKVPEVTIWFWAIKVLCTTVGESFADWINMTLGVGLITTSVLFTAVLAGVLGWQLSTKRYVPFVYWLTVVVLSVTGTLYTDILTDSQGVPLAVSSSVFAVVLAVVFGIWYARERTLSIHSIVTRPRELFYWLAVLVTFALGTATGDWTLELTGWPPGISVLLPLGLIAAIVFAWRFGAGVVLSFWLAYILTRPLGANLGDWLASPSGDGGLGLGTAVTSVVFLAAILATVLYLSRSRSDVIEGRSPARTVRAADPAREKIMLGYYAVVAVATVALLVWAHQQPHAAVASEEGDAQGPASAPLTPEQATSSYPPAEVAKLRTITADTLAKLNAGDQAAATTRITDLEKTWDDDQPTLQPKNQQAWTFLDGEIDQVLKALRAPKPNKATEADVLNTLLASLSSTPQQSPASAPAAGAADTPAPASAPPASGQATSSFPPAEIAKLRTITADTLAKLNAGNQAAATTRITDLEKTWDDDQPTLQPKNQQAWTFLDGEIDQVLKALRAPKPNKATEVKALDTLLTSLG
ncbi:COG4705 family protein [Kitasatospora sp. McL0602]|uniref:COG4705 family protein n=1 Tax=Kitasatospora sp. McL0602 TaxID=3439530 RepID=UPI003F8BB40C